MLVFWINQLKQQFVLLFYFGGGSIKHKKILFCIQRCGEIVVIDSPDTPEFGCNRGRVLP